MPREIDLRRPDFQPGAEVMLCDGQLWHFPRPTLLYRMHLDPETRSPVMKLDASGQSATYAQILDRLDRAESDGNFFSWIAAAALELLSRNYDIPDEYVPKLLVFDPGSEINQTTWSKLVDAIRGRLLYPKA